MLYYGSNRFGRVEGRREREGGGREGVREPGRVEPPLISHTHTHTHTHTINILEAVVSKIECYKIVFGS